MSRIIVFVDVDGYAKYGMSSKYLIKNGKDGYRARELGWHIARYDLESKQVVSLQSDSIYFRDPTTIDLLDTYDKAVWYVYKNIHGLPINPESYTKGSKIMLSTHVPGAFKLLLKKAKRYAALEEIIFVHKGGSEGVWLRECDFGVRIIDIGEYGCPKIEKLISKSKDCGNHSGIRKKIIHCPRYELEVMIQWMNNCRLDIV